MDERHTQQIINVQNLFILKKLLLIHVNENQNYDKLKNEIFYADTL